MIFRVRAYRTVDGKCPVREFLEEHGRSNPDSYDFLIAGIRKLCDKKYHQEPLSKKLKGNKFSELRNVSSGARIIFAFRPKQLIVLLLGIIKKTNELPQNVVRQAQTYHDDYLLRCTGDEELINEQF